MTAANERPNSIILSVETDDIKLARNIIRNLSDYVAGILVPTWLRGYTNLFSFIRKEMKNELWLNIGATYPSQLRGTVADTLIQLFSHTDSRSFLYPKGFIVACSDNLIPCLRYFFEEEIRKFNKRVMHYQIPKHWQPEIYVTTALTMASSGNGVLEKAQVAKEVELTGVIAPCQLIPEIKEMGLSTILTAIRDPKFSVLDDDQIITCSPEEARETKPDYCIFGRGITDPIVYHDDFQRAIEATKYFVDRLDW